MSHQTHVGLPNNIHGGEARITWIDAGRGLAMLLVVYNHVCMGLWTAGLPFWPNPYSSLFLLIRSIMLPLLLFCSGALVEQSLQNGLPEFLIKKTQRLLIPYIIWSVILAACYWSFAAWMNVAPRATGPVDLLILGGGGPLLFLAWLFLAQLFYALLRTVGLPAAWILVPAAALALAIRPVNMLADSFSIGPGMLLFIVLGAVAGSAIHCIARGSVLQALLASLIAIGLLAAVAVIVGTRPRLDPAIRTGLAILGAFCGATIASAAARAIIARPLVLIGRYSLEILVVHTLATAGTRVLLARGLHTRDMVLHLTAGTFVGAAVPIALAWLAGRYRLHWLFDPRPKRSDDK